MSHSQWTTSSTAGRSIPTDALSTSTPSFAKHALEYLTCFLTRLMFNPMRSWLTRGPLSKLWHDFVWSPVPIHYKISVFAYVCSYYGSSFCHQPGIVC